MNFCNREGERNVEGEKEGRKEGERDREGHIASRIEKVTTQGSLRATLGK